MVLRSERSPLLRPRPTPAPVAADEELQVEQLRQALQVLRRAPHLSRDARLRGTRALEAACARLAHPSRRS